MNELSKEMVSHFENLKHIDEKGVEYWSARELYPLLGYTQWRNFELIIEKAKISCEKASGSSLYDFADVSKIVSVGPTEKSVKDYFLTRYACYLIAQNGDSRKAEIAQAQTYFAIQTRYAEIKQMEEYKSLTTEEEMRLFLRQQLRRHNSELADAAHNAGVMTSLDYAIFQNFGYKGLYNGLDAKAIARRKGIKKSGEILDYMESAELAANLFRATQTAEKLKVENPKNKTIANKIHLEIGQKVRKAIADIGGTMPENLPTADNIKKVESKKKAILKNQEKFKQLKKDNHS